MRPRRAGRVILIGAFVLAALAGCGGSGGGNETPAPTATVAIPTATTATVATPAPRIELGEVVFAAEVDPATGGPVTPTTSLGRSTPTIHAFIQTSLLPAGTTLRAEWSINGIAVPTLMQEVTLNAERPAGWVEFHLALNVDQPWPSGALQVAITVDGAATVTGTVNLSGF